MKQFIAKFGDQIQGTLSGFDRVVFRGSLRSLTPSQGRKMHLIQNIREGNVCALTAMELTRISRAP